MMETTCTFSLRQDKTFRFVTKKISCCMVNYNGNSKGYNVSCRAVNLSSSMLQEVMLNRLYYGFAVANLPLVITELVAVVIGWDNVNK